jgi:hypothetical protein
MQAIEHVPVFYSLVTPCSLILSALNYPPSALTSIAIRASFLGLTLYDHRRRCISDIPDLTYLDFSEVLYSEQYESCLD